MQKEIKLMIAANAVLGALFLLCTFIYAYFASIRPTTVVWGPCTLTFYNPEAAATIGDVGSTEPNFSFIIFWALLLINVYFLIKLSRAKSHL